MRKCLRKYISGKRNFYKCVCWFMCLYVCLFVNKHDMLNIVFIWDYVLSMWLFIIWNVVFMRLWLTICWNKLCPRLTYMCDQCNVNLLVVHFIWIGINIELNMFLDSLMSSYLYIFDFYLIYLSCLKKKKVPNIWFNTQKNFINYWSF